jgi:hypothetical protein
LLSRGGRRGVQRPSPASPTTPMRYGDHEVPMRHRRQAPRTHRPTLPCIAGSPPCADQLAWSCPWPEARADLGLAAGGLDPSLSRGGRDGAIDLRGTAVPGVGEQRRDGHHLCAGDVDDTARSLPAEPCPGRWRCLCSDGRFVSGTDLLRNQSSERLESAESQQPTDTSQYQGTCCGGPRARHGTC